MSAKHHNYRVQWRVFKCLECGRVLTCPKHDTRHKTRNGHIKSVWCYRCGKRTKHVQISK